MDTNLADGMVQVEPPAREQFFDTRGYGRPRGEGLALAPVEAAHLLYRGDLQAVDGMDLPAFLAATSSVLPFIVYRDLRERGFYVSPAREGWVPDPAGSDLIVHPRGTGPQDDEVAYQLRVVGERQPVPATDLGEFDLAVVDEDGELTYLEIDKTAPSGTAATEAPASNGRLLEDRILVSDPPPTLHDHLFYGQRLGGRTAEGGPLLLSLIEAAHLAEEGLLTLEETPSPGEIVARGTAVEGQRFNRRLAAYGELRRGGVVPKSGFKFGTDFRAYESFETVETVDHSESLIRVMPADHVFTPRDLSLDVRLATSVRKRARYALVTSNGSVEWLTVDRLTP